MTLGATPRSARQTWHAGPTWQRREISHNLPILLSGGRRMPGGEFTRWWYLIGHGGGYCAPDDGNFTLVMDAFCKGYGFKWAVLNGARPVGDCMIWSGQVAPVYDTIVCGP